MSGRHQPTKVPPKGPAKAPTRAPASTAQPTSPQPPSSNTVSDLIGLVIDRDSVCERTSALYTNAKKTQWNINTSLEPFFKDARVFRSIQGKTETLIGSEFAGKFVRRLQVKTGLQLFTEIGVKINAIIEYLKRESYILETTLSGDGQFGFSSIPVFKKSGPGGGNQTSIALWHCEYSPIDAFLKGCLCSARACFISWNKAYGLFPIGTTLKRTSYLMTPMTDTEPSPAIVALKRESAEGFTVKTGYWRAGPTSKLEPEFDMFRSIGDKYSWAMKLDTTDVTPAPAPESLLDGVQFSVSVSSSLSKVPFLRFDYHVLTSCVLKHTYICLPRDIYSPAAQQDAGIHRKYREKLDHLSAILNAEAAVQLTMLEPADRPPQYSEIISRNHGKSDGAAKGHFKVPRKWNYFDNEIQRELKLMLQESLDPELQSPSK